MMLSITYLLLHYVPKAAADHARRRVEVPARSPRPSPGLNDRPGRALHLPEMTTMAVGDAVNHTIAG
ncbi:MULTISPECIES: hypothetical protein [unclassified Frankia]